MKYKTTIIPLVVLLTGCPGGNPASQYRGVFMHDDVICFSVDEKDTLDYYNIYSTRKDKYITVIADERIHLSYPDTCFKVQLKHGYNYVLDYGLNGIKYTDSFFIDNDGNR